jgi:hypothetical protein
MVNTPAHMDAWIHGLYADPATRDAAMQSDLQQAKIPTDPQALADMRNQIGLGLEKYVADKTQQRGQDVSSATQIATNNATNKTHLQVAGMQQSGENQRAALGRQTQLTVAGLNPDGTLSNNVEGTAQAIAKGQIAPLSGFALARPAGQQVMARVMQINPQYDGGDFAAKAQALKSFATGEGGQAIQSANTAVNHLDTLRRLAEAQKNGDMRTFYMIANKISTEFGGVAPSNLQATVTLVGPEISKAVVGAGGGQGDRDKVDSALAALTKGGPAQAAGTIGTMQDIFGGRLTEAQRTYERTTKRNDFATSLLSPAAATVLAKRTGSAPAAHPPEINDLLKKYGQ